jgi:hypothetical protein
MSLPVVDKETKLKYEITFKEEEVKMKLKIHVLKVFI